MQRKHQSSRDCDTARACQLQSELIQQRRPERGNAREQNLNQQYSIAEQKPADCKDRRIDWFERRRADTIEAEHASADEIVGQREIVTFERRTRDKQISDTSRDCDAEQRAFANTLRGRRHITRAPSVLTFPQNRSLSRRAADLNAACIAAPIRFAAPSS